MANLGSAIRRGIVKQRKVLVYALRTLATIALMPILWRVLVGLFYFNQLPEMEVQFLGGLDYLRAMFYGLLPAIALFLVRPVLPPVTSGRSINFILSFVIAFAVCALPLFAILPLRPEARFPTIILLSFILLTTNLFLDFTHPLYAEGPRAHIAATCDKLGLLADAFVPVLVWHVYRDRKLPFARLARLCAGVLVFLPTLLALLFYLMTMHAHPATNSGAKRLFVGNYFQSQFTAPDTVLAVDGTQRLVRLDLAAEQMTVAPAFVANGAIGFGLSADERRILLLGVSRGVFEALQLDAASLQPISRRLVELPREEYVNGTTLPLWDEQRDIVLAVIEDALAVWDADLTDVSQVIELASLDGVLDPSRPLAYLVSWQMVKAFDCTTMQTFKFLSFPTIAYRLKLDPAQDRLFVSFPMEGLVRIIDLSSFSLAGEIQTMIGARAVHVLPKKRLLLVAGFSPYFEIYSLDYFTLLTRVVAPTWVRHILSDESEETLFLATADGFWEMPLPDVLTTQSFVDRFRKIDPFFSMIRALPSFYLRFSDVMQNSPPIRKPGK